MYSEAETALVTLLSTKILHLRPTLQLLRQPQLLPLEAAHAVVVAIEALLSRTGSEAYMPYHQTPNK